MRVSTQRRSGGDRLAVALLGLLLVAAGLLVADWQLRLAHAWPQRLDVTPVTDVVDAAWWPWAFTAAGLVLGLWALASQVRRLPRVQRSRPLPVAADDDGTTAVVTGALADTVAARLQELAPLATVSAKVEALGDERVVEARATLADDADVDDVLAAVRQVDEEIDLALGAGRSRTRLLLSSPKPLGRLRAEGPPEVSVDQPVALPHGTAQKNAHQQTGE